MKAAVFHLIEYALCLLGVGLALWLPGRAVVEAGWIKTPKGLSTLAQIVVGISLWTVAIFALSAIGGWNDAGLKSLLLVFIACWIGVRRRVPRFARPAPAARGADPMLLLTCAIVLVSLIAIGLHAISPEVSWDASAYHLTVPRLYNEAGGFRAIEMNVYSNWPLSTELLFSAAMLANDYILAKAVHFGFGILTLAAIVLACRGAGRETGAIGGALWLLSPVVLFEFPIAYIELATAFWLTAAVVFLLRAKQRPAEAGPALLLSGLCCAGVIGTKVTGIAAAGAVGLLYTPDLARSIRNGDARVKFIEFGRNFLVPIIVLSLPWLIKAAWFTGNPIYPFGFELFGGPDWSAALASRFEAWQRGLGMGRGPIDYLLLPMRVVWHTGDGAAGFGNEIGRYWALVVPLSIAFGLRSPVVRGCLAVSGSYFVFWSLSAQNARFLIPILPLLAIAGALTITSMIERSSRHRPIRNAVLAACSGALVWTHLGSWVDGAKLAVLYQLRWPELQRAATDPVFGFIDRELPPDARVLMLNTNQGFFCPREFLADSFFEASQITEWLGSASSRAQLLERLRNRGVTHLLRFDQQWGGLEYPLALRELIDDPRAAERIYRAGRFEVFALR